MKEKIKKIFQSKMFLGAVYSIVTIFIIALIFHAGEFVGFRKATLGKAWGDNYAENFGIMRPNIFGTSGNLPNSDGAVGKIIKVSLPTITVMDDKDKTEKIVVIGDDTEIHQMRTDIPATTLAVDNYVVVIGVPNAQGQIDAKLIRLIPAPSVLN